MIAFKIALNGMKGRRKDTLLLLLVIILSFAFIVSATMFYAGINTTEEINRTDNYGKWNAAYADGDQEDGEFFRSSEYIDKVSTNGIVDLFTNAGVIGTIDESFLELEGTKMICGKLPESENELALELATASKLGLTKEDIGKDIVVESKKITLITEEKKINRFERANHDIHKHIENTPLYANDDIAISTMVEYLYSDKSGQAIAKCNDLNSIIVSKSITIYRHFIVSGFIETYSDRWSVGDAILANAFISPSSAKNYYNACKQCEEITGENTTVFVQNTRYNYFLYSNKYQEELKSKLQSSFSKYIEEKKNSNEDIVLNASQNLIINYLSYPENINKQKQNFIYSVMTAIFMVSAGAILQLYLTQVRRRARTFSLLKSIGAINKQVTEIFIYEGIVLLAIGMPVGVGLGVGLSVASKAIAQSSGGVLSVGFIPSLFYKGIGACCISLFVGMLAPIIYALNIPLTGVIEKPLKHQKDYGCRKDFKLLLNSLSTEQTISMIGRTHNRVNRGKTLMTSILSIIACTLICFAILLGYVCHGTYIDTIKEKGKPDYILEYLYGMDTDSILEKMKPVLKAKGVECKGFIWQGNGLHLYYAGLPRDKIVSSFRKNIPEAYRDTYFGSEKECSKYTKVSRAIITNFYGISVNGKKDIKNSKAIYDKVANSITEGEINISEFSIGKEVVIVLPMYKQLDGQPSEENFTKLENTPFEGGMAAVLESSGQYKLSLSRDDAYSMRKNTGIRVGDDIWLSVDQEIQAGTNLIHEYDPVYVRVSGIIRYFKDDPIWSISQNNQGYAVIGSDTLMGKLYKGYKSSDVDSLDSNVIKLMTKTTCKVKLGKTLIYLDANSTSDFENTDIPLIKCGKQQGFKLTNYRNTNQMLLAEAKNNTAIVALLCITSAILALIILYNILSSTAEQERKRTGILQAIGITGSELTRIQLKTGLKNAIISIIFAHVIISAAVCVIVAFTSSQTGLSLSAYISRMSRYYPIGIHLIAMVIYFITAILIYTLPFIPAIKCSPIENINE